MMKKWIFFEKAPLWPIKIFQRRNKVRMRRSFLKLKFALAQEKLETIHMLNTYKAHSLGKSNKADLKLAHQQLGDILKGVGLGMFLLLPLSPVTIPIIIKLAKRFGIDILPTAFNTENASDESSVVNHKSA